MAAICSECGKPLGSNAVEGLCPECLLRVGLGTEPGGSAPGAGSARRFAPPEPEELAPSFPQLEILELLGRGGMGAVYRAKQRGLDRVVALKVLPVEIGHDPAFAERFAREARALARLSHPNIIAVHEFGEAGGFYYFVMEFVDGINLRQMLRARRLSPREAMAIVPQICDALQYAHDQGIVHRDIKPENLLVDRQGRVKIADFGLAKLLGKTPQGEALTRSAEVMGTPQYMAPEQLEKPLEVDHRADIFSLGVVFYEMLTGELPMGRFAPPSKKVQVDVRLDEIVLHALEKEPERRYQHASEVKTDVETITAAKPVGRPDRDSPRPARGRKATALLLSALAVLGFLLLGILLVPGERPARPPRVLSLTPANGSTNVDPALTEIRVVFDQPMLDRSWSMTGGGDHFPEGVGAARYDAARTTWLAPVKLRPNWDYGFGLNSESFRNFRNAKGLALEPIWVTFHTRPEPPAERPAAPPVGPPRVVSMTPADGATNVDPDLTEIRVVFDQPMMDGSWSMCGEGPTFPAGPGPVHYDATRTTWTAPIYRLKRGAKYEFGLNCGSHRNFKNQKGVPLEPVWVTFWTAE